MFKELLKDLYERVVKAYQYTFLGIGIAAGAVVADAFVASPNKVLSLVGVVIGGVLALYKGKYPAPPPQLPPSNP